MRKGKYPAASRGEQRPNRCTPPHIGRGRQKLRTAEVAGGRKPAQPSIPEGILGFPPPDALLQCTAKTKAKLLKANHAAPGVPGKKLLGASKIAVVLAGCGGFRCPSLSLT
jgi:hypothetical protein